MSLVHIEGAVIREQGVTFAVVVVKRSALNSHDREQLCAQFSHQLFGGLPVVLMAQDSNGTPTYYGRDDLSRFMSTVPLEAVTWKRYSFSTN